MHMTLYFGYDATILFDFWKSEGFSGFWISFVLMFFISLLFEMLKASSIAYAIEQDQMVLGNLKRMNSSSETANLMEVEGQVFNQKALKNK
eukprot:Nk52_evm1s946 gene=Nk52_evmTU1s946